MTLKDLLATKTQGLLNIYCTAGYPALNDLPDIIKGLYVAGVDMVEIGMPYSDPIADGPTIQRSNARALKNGIDIEAIFDQLDRCEPEIPKILMGYFNPVYQYGVEKFCKHCKVVGVDAVIIPDLPLDLYEARYKSIFERFGLSNIFLITPETTLERIKKIDAMTDTFIYAVSSSSTTGKGQGIASANSYLEGLKDLPVSHPILVGFNISEPQDLALVQEYAAGGIIGSAFIKFIEDRTDLTAASQEFVRFITSKTTVS